jgi:hypothetical protein
LRDVAACELACAEVRIDIEEREPEAVTGEGHAPGRRIRRRPSIVLLRCSHDIRSIFEDGAEGSHPAERDTPIVVAMPPGADRPQVFELAPAIFDLLAALDAWVDPTELGAPPELEQVINELTEHGLLEVRG